jgi:hypothetical protein
MKYLLTILIAAVSLSAIGQKDTLRVKDHIQYMCYNFGDRIPDYAADVVDKMGKESELDLWLIGEPVKFKTLNKIAKRKGIIDNKDGTYTIGKYTFANYENRWRVYRYFADKKNNSL